MDSLYNPETKLPYKEFQIGNDTYIEVEPGAQYFVDIQLIKSDDVLDSAKQVKAHLIVDEHDHGCHAVIPSNGDLERMGMYHQNEIRSLAFTLSRLNVVKEAGVENGSCNSITPACGQVIVCFHEESAGCCPYDFCPTHAKLNLKALFLRYKEMASIDVTTSQEMELKNKKVMRSVEGTATISQNFNMIEVDFGRHLTTVTLNYCSAAGLIMVGALEKPYPEWGPMNGIVRKRPAAALEADDKIKESITTYHDSNGLAREAFLIDLTNL